MPEIDSDALFAGRITGTSGPSQEGPSFISAMRLYDRFGFSVESMGLHPGMIDDPLDDLIYMVDVDLRTRSFRRAHKEITVAPLTLDPLVAGVARYKETGEEVVGLPICEELSSVKEP